jgi:hypothetical protein
MIEFLLFAILLVLCPALQRLLGTLVLVVVGLWAYGHYLAPSPPAERPPVASEEVAIPLPPPLLPSAPAAAPVPDTGTGIDIRPARPYRQQ